MSLQDDEPLKMKFLGSHQAQTLCNDLPQATTLLHVTTYSFIVISPFGVSATMMRSTLPSLNLLGISTVFTIGTYLSGLLLQQRGSMMYTMLCSIKPGTPTRLFQASFPRLCQGLH
mmetsp:Transcript_8053/g.11063  ORF Transcript_8053/g.11063 Transcript_8053/m.11063 type:complete len:116 (-) Transcript_8053:188-535(-)